MTGLPGALTPTGIAFPAVMSFEACRKAAEQLAQVARFSLWAVVDLIGTMKAQPWTKTKDWTQVFQDLDYSPETLRKAEWMWDKFPPEARRQGMSYSHHMAVAGLDNGEKTKLLREAEKVHWSAAQLREEVRAVRGLPLQRKVRWVTCPKCHERFQP